jgi:thiamine-phosphate pyrophosphorylase
MTATWSSARAILGPDKDPRRLVLRRFCRRPTAVAAGADYVAFGAVYPSLTKPHAVATVDLFFQAKTG